MQVCSITYARIQGKNAMVAHFQNSSLLHEDKRCRPVLFHSQGALAGLPEPFPAAPSARCPPPPPLFSPDTVLALAYHHSACASKLHPHCSRG